MAFFESDSANGSFVIHFTQDPMTDFGIWAEGYAQAASSLSQTLVARPFAQDSEAYPVVFLYRHALELYLKAVIIEGGHLNWLRHQDAAEKLHTTHRLPPLVELADRILAKAFPGDPSVVSLVERLKEVAEDLDEVDPGSVGFRYPVGTTGMKPVPSAVHMSLVKLSDTMDPLLEELSTLDFALAGEIYAEEEYLGLVFRLGP